MAYCERDGWTIVGYDMALLVSDVATVRVDVLVLDERDHYLAVSAAVLDGDQGIGIIDLKTGQGRFAPAATPGSRLRN